VQIRRFLTHLVGAAVLAALPAAGHAVPPAALLTTSRVVRAEGTQGVAPAQAAILPGPLVIPECSPLSVDETLTLGYHLFTVTCRVVDATGSGNGWRVLLTASAASGTGGGPGPGPRAPFPSTVAEITNVSQQLIAGGLALPTGSVAYPVPLSDDQPEAVFDAGTDSGMGQVLLTIDGRISQQQYVRAGVPGLTFSIIAGP
jgi:hypothetical protein